MTKNIITSLVFAFIIANLSAQNTSEEIHKCIDASQKGESCSFDYNIFSNPKESKKALKILPDYLNDSLPGIRLTAVKLFYYCGLQSNELKIKQNVVEYIANACGDNNSGVSSYASNCLTSFKQSDFNSSSKSTIKELISKHSFNYDVVIKLVGLADMKEMIPVLKNNLITDSLLTKKDRWAIHLTMARLGDKSSINYCLLRSKKYKVDNNYVHQIVPDLIYTKQKEVFNYLVELLNSENKSCVSSNPDSDQRIPCGYRVMEDLAPVIVNYPLQLLPGGDIDTKDYKSALSTVRKWFAKNPDYEIITDTY